MTNKKLGFKAWLAKQASFFTSGPVMTGRTFCGDEVVEQRTKSTPNNVKPFIRKPGPAVYVPAEREFYLDSIVKRGSHVNMVLKDVKSGIKLQVSEYAFASLFKLK